jgi:argininosuccinate synthase
MKKKDLILAYSGGLDTTFCAVFLNKVKNYNVHAVTINTGAFSTEDIALLEKKACEIGVSSFICIDVRKEFYADCIKYLIFGNVLKNGTYPLSVSAERVIQAMSIANYSKKLGIHTIAHGSTGAGNDQVRFDMILQHVIPNVTIITPIRDERISREAEIDFLIQHDVVYDFKKAKYSINKGIWGTSIGGVETLTSHASIPEESWPTQVTETNQKDITLHFKQGELVGIDALTFDHPVAAIEHLQAIAQPFGIGRDIHVGDTIIGIKGRVGFEAAAPILIIKAHHLLEKHVLTKHQLSWKEQLAAWYGNWLHEGQLLDPIMQDIEAFLKNSQKTVSGEVYISLFPYRFVLNGIKSSYDLMSNKFGTYGEMNNAWTGDDVKGFTKIFGNQTSIFHQVQKENEHENAKN